MKITMFRTNGFVVSSKIVLSLIVFSGTALAMEQCTMESARIQDDLDPVMQAKEHLQLGERHAKGEGVPLDYGIALRHFEIAAAQDFNIEAKAQALFRLGSMYYLGQGVERNKLKMRLCLAEVRFLAEGNVSLRGVEKLAYFLENRQLVFPEKSCECSMLPWSRATRSELAARCGLWDCIHLQSLGQEELVELLITAGPTVKADPAEIAHAKAFLRMGKMYMRGLESQRNYGLARDCLEKAEQQDVDKESAQWACLMLAQLYYFGWGVEKDDIKKEHYLVKSGAGVKHYENDQIAVILRDPKIDVNDNGRFSSCGPRLCEAADSGHLNLVELLIALGADVNIVSSHHCGGTALHIAAGKNYLTVIKLLLAHGANVSLIDYTGHTPLHSAASEGYKQIVEILLAHGADVAAVSKYGRTPLEDASLYRKEEIVELLRAHSDRAGAKSELSSTGL